MPTGTAPSGTPKYLIGAVTKLTGLSIDVVRVWERRYGAVRPARSGGGTRLYSDADVLRLRRLRQAVEKGFGIGQAAKLSESELDQLISDPQSVDGADPYRAVRERFFQAVEIMDVAAADRELARAATLFPAREFVKKIVAPILDEVGERWAHQEFGAVHEHLASGLLRGMVGSLFRIYPPSENAQTVILATPGEERHEFGLLLAALLAATHGWRVVYLGGDLRAAEMAHAVRLTNAPVLALNLAAYSAHVEGELEALSALLPDSTLVWIGGAEAMKFEDLIQRAGWELLRDLDHLDDTLKR